VPAVIDIAADFEQIGGAMMLLALVVFGLMVGSMAGLFGVGGAFIVTPMLIVLFGVDESTAVGSSLCFIVGTSAAGLSRHWRLGNVDIRATVSIGAGSVVGAILGVMLHEHLKAWLGTGEGFDFPILIRSCYLVLLPIAAFLAYRDPKPHHSGKSPLQRLPLGPRISLPSVGQQGVSLPGLCVLGMAVGVLTGLLGVGGGVLYMPLLLVVVALPAHQAVGTSLGVVLASAVAGTAKHGLEGNVNLLVAIALLAGSSIGVQIGAAVCTRLKGRKLRRWFAVAVLLALVVMATDLAVKVIER